MKHNLFKWNRSPETLLCVNHDMMLLISINDAKDAVYIEIKRSDHSVLIVKRKLFAAENYATYPAEYFDLKDRVLAERAALKSDTKGDVI